MDKLRAQIAAHPLRNKPYNAIKFALRALEAHLSRCVDALGDVASKAGAPS